MHHVTPHHNVIGCERYEKDRNMAPLSSFLRLSWTVTDRADAEGRAVVPKGIPTAPPRGFSCVRGATVSLLSARLWRTVGQGGLLRTLHLSALRGVPPRPLWAVRAPSRVLRKISKRGYCVCFSVWAENGFGLFGLLRLRFSVWAELSVCCVCCALCA